MLAVIYQIVRKGTTKCYVGSTKNESERKKVHLKSLDKGNHHSQYLQNAWNKYGGRKGFSWKILKIYNIHIPKRFATEKQINTYYKKKRKIKETFWIENSNSVYNMTKAANGVFIFAEETKRKISKAKMGNIGRTGQNLSIEHKRKIGEANLGRKHTKEAREKISKAKIGKPSPHLGKKMSKEARQKMSKAKIGKKFSINRRREISKRLLLNNPFGIQVIIDNNEYPSMSAAARNFSLDIRTVSSRCRSKDLQWQRWKFK